MFIDITLKITSEMVEVAQKNEKKSFVGHIGTHFDVMNKEFPLDYAKRTGIVFDVSNVKNKDIDISDVDLSKVQQDSFVMFYTGYIEKVGYGNKVYFKEHPQLSNELIDALIDKGVSIIGVDFAGVRRGKEHPCKDQYCADNGVFIIENLCNLNDLVNLKTNLIIYTFPMNYEGMSGLPCRVLAEILV